MNNFKHMGKYREHIMNAYMPIILFNSCYHLPYLLCLFFFFNEFKVNYHLCNISTLTIWVFISSNKEHFLT